MKLLRSYFQPSLSSSPNRGASTALLYRGESTRKRLGRYLLMLALLLTSLAGNYQTAHAIFAVAPSNEMVVGLLSNNRIVVFNSISPDIILSSKLLTGLGGGERVLAIDFRPATGQLYGYTNYNRLVTINVASGATTLVASLSVGLAGNKYAIDFNPDIDQLRIVNDTDQNASVDPDTGAATLQTPLNPGNPNVVGIAFDRDTDIPNAVPSLYDIDSNTDSLYKQNPPAAGTITLVGALGTDTTNFTGFDISNSSGIAYASLTPTGSNASTFYSIDLATGTASTHGGIGGTALLDMAISPVLPPTIFGLTNSNRLITFDSSRPDIILSNTAITGLKNGENVLGIDFRPATGQLYGYTSYNRIITINTATGAATVLGALSTPLQGNAYGMDFNPVPDRIRIVNDTDQNVRVNPSTGAIAAVDPSLTYAPGDPNNGQNPNIVGLAYTNNFAGTTSTTLYDIDSNLDILTTQGGLNSNPSPNTGQLFTVGPLGVNTNNNVGFDIAGTTGAVYASLTPSGTLATKLYTINLATGAATLINQIGSSPTLLRGIAIGPIAAPTMFGVTTSNTLVSFNASSPNTLTSSKPITGLAMGEAVLGIDFRPANGQLYGYTSNQRLIIINTATGAATPTHSVASTGVAYGLDFNPVVDRLRIVTDTNQNLRVDVDSGTLIPDGALVYNAGDPNSAQDPNVVAAAYTNNFAGATSTTLYDIDSALDILAIQNPPNTGTLNTVGPLGVDISNLTGFDIAPTTNAAYAALQPAAGGSSNLYTINLSTGQATFIGTIGGGIPLRGLAIAPAGTIQFASAGTTVTEGTDFSVTIPVTRTGDISGFASVNYTTQNGTASAGSDYLSTSGTLFFNPGETTKNIVVSLLNDAPPEPTETFNVLLSSPTGGFSIGPPSTFVVTILDND